jgi:hypothetical protein
MSARNFLAVLVVTLAGCAAGPKGTASLPAIETYQAGDIIVSTSGSGILRPYAGCLVFVRQGGALAAQFPQGTAYQGKLVRLPNGELIPLGTSISLVFEARPGTVSRLPGCNRYQAIQVIRRRS